MEELRQRLLDMSAEQDEERNGLSREISQLTGQLAGLRTEVAEAREGAATERARVEALEGEKSALEKQLEEVRAALDAEKARPRTPPPPPAPPAQPSSRAAGKSGADGDGDDDEDEDASKTDAEKEQEDLLVLLEELSSKRRADKARMKEAGLDVSEDEEEDGDDDDDDE